MNSLIREIGREAALSRYKESYRVIKKCDDYRLGIGARLDGEKDPSYYIEVIIYICNSRDLDPSKLVSKARGIVEMEKRGYILGCQGDDSVLIEKELEAGCIVSEICKIKSILTSSIPKGRRI